MFYRYELWIGDEDQQIGILQGLDDTGLSEEHKDALIDAFDGLPIPPDDILENGNTRSWFTEDGRDCFEYETAEVLAAYDEDGLFDIVVLEEPELDGEIAYEDDWPVLVWQ